MGRMIGLLSVILLMAGCNAEQKQPVQEPKARLGEPAAPAISYVTIGTGGVTGVYYPTGGAISQIVNAKRKQYHLRMTVESTPGSVYNVNAVLAGDLQFGIVQSDRQFQAYNGTADWLGAPRKDLRSVFSIHPETVTLVAAVDTGIEGIADLIGKRVNIGNPGSGQRGNALHLLDAAGINSATELEALGIKAAQAPAMLQDGSIDAFFYTVGHPNGSVKEAVTGPRKVRFVPVDAELIEALVAEFPYYAPATIPIAPYLEVANETDVPSFGVKATLVTSADVADEVVYAVTKEIFENLDEFKKLHPAYRSLTKESMLQGLSAPIHPGALTYYREAGFK